MKYVAVRHKENQSKLYWFAVPDELNEYVHVGDTVYCDTRRGFNKGRIVTVLDGVTNLENGDDEVRRIIGDFALKSIVAVQVDYNINDITIPYEMEITKPSPEKILKRINEFYTDRIFRTKVIIRFDGTLKDGYTAYLVAKMFGCDTLHGYCVAVR